ncbi:MAG: hypothetical protein FWG51_01595 [Firmicutes bacterium]|nr:hypothetical protein [Bacillota bacterium]
MKCFNCNREMQAGELKSCPYCGNVLCNECSDKNINLCSSCYSDMKFLN